MSITAATATTRNSATERIFWRAVTDRDASFDGRFVYSVATTGVYCRPSCPARQANRSNVEFHASCAAAELAGFRACKRCRPNAVAPKDELAAKITAACRSIETADESPTLRDLAAKAGLSPYHFHRVFKAATGVTPKAYAMAHRQDRVRNALARTTTVTEAIYEAGFNSSGRFYAGSNAALGMSPSAYRRGGKDLAMTFAVGDCSLGSVLVAMSTKGVTAIFFGDDAQALALELENRFPNATLSPGDRAFKKIIAQVIRLVEAPASGLNLPLDVRGTAFQHRVWQALQEIPSGTTATYADIANRIGKPAAVRAVGAACGANPVAVAIPCHRVIRSDGDLSGYRWGIERKRVLLAREREGKAQKKSG